MFSINSLPPPTTFANEHRPLRLSAETARSQPHGGCQQLHAGSLVQRCPCLSYHHNRGAPGNICDCGHSACYHAQNAGEVKPPPDVVISALTEKVKKLEEHIIKEREIRDSILSRERENWEREVRTLREALAPFYKNEKQMSDKILVLADRLESGQDEQMRLRERIVAVDDVTSTLERRVDMLEHSHPRKRKDHHDVDDSATSPGSHDCRSTSSHQSSLPPSPRSRLYSHGTSRIRSISPRSSGVLNLTTPSRTMHGLPPHAAVTQNNNNISRGMMHQYEEPRSSGFLGVDLAERLSQRAKKSPTASADQLLSSNNANRKTESPSSPSSRLPSPQAPMLSGPPNAPLYLPPLLPADGFIKPGLKMEVSSPKRRKHQVGNIMALDVLANVSVASPLIH